jgi:hypothetical protein
MTIKALNKGRGDETNTKTDRHDTCKPPAANRTLPVAPQLTRSTYISEGVLIHYTGDLCSNIPSPEGYIPLTTRRLGLVSNTRSCSIMSRESSCEMRFFESPCRRVTKKYIHRAHTTEGESSPHLSFLKFGSSYVTWKGRNMH